MNHDQKCRVLKMVLASLQNAVVANPSNKPADAGQPAESALTEAQVNSALDVVNSVLKQPEDPSVDANLSAVDIAALVLQILQLILSHFPGGTPAPAPAPAIDATSILTIAETIMQILELILSKLPKSASPAPAAVRENALSATDIAGLVLAILQLLLSKFGTPAPAPAPAPAPGTAS